MPRLQAVTVTDGGIVGLASQVFAHSGMVIFEKVFLQIETDPDVDFSAKSDRVSFEPCLEIFTDRNCT